VRLGDGGRDLLVGHVGVLGSLRAGDLLTGHRQLDLVDTDLDEPAHGLAHLVGPVGEPGDALDQLTAGHRDLRPVGQVTRPGDAAGVDRVPAHHVEPVLRGRGPQAHGVTGIEVGPCRLDREQQVLLDRQSGQAVEVATVVPAEVGVSVAQAGHQRPAAALDHPGTGGGPGIHRADRGDVVVIDQDIARVRPRTGGVQNGHIVEQGFFWRYRHVSPRH